MPPSSWTPPSGGPPQAEEGSLGVASRLGGGRGRRCCGRGLGSIPARIPELGLTLRPPTPARAASRLPRARQRGLRHVPHHLGPTRQNAGQCASRPCRRVSRSRAGREALHSRRGRHMAAHPARSGGRGSRLRPLRSRSGFPRTRLGSLAELSSVRGRFGLAVERDATFVARRSLSAYARSARRAGGIVA